jgi:hypothetical protein
MKLRIFLTLMTPSSSPVQKSQDVRDLMRLMGELFVLVWSETRTELRTELRTCLEGHPPVCGCASLGELSCSCVEGADARSVLAGRVDG